MSEIPYLPFDSKIDDLTEQDGVFSGTGELIAPFTMVDASNENQFSSLGPNVHAFVSWLPLYDDCYWIMILQGELKADLPALVYQFLPLTNNGPFSFYFLKMKKPFRYRQLNFFDRQYPFERAEQQRRTGVIKHVEIPDFTDSNSILDPELLQNKFIDSTLTDDLIRLGYGEQMGVDYL